MSETTKITVEYGCGRKVVWEEKPDQVVTTPRFWDCGCENDKQYIQKKDVGWCPICRVAETDGQPDSRIPEVVEMLLQEAAKDRPKDCTISVQDAPEEEVQLPRMVTTLEMLQRARDCEFVTVKPPRIANSDLSEWTYRERDGHIEVRQKGMLQFNRIRPLKKFLKAFPAGLESKYLWVVLQAPPKQPLVKYPEINIPVGMKMTTEELIKAVKDPAVGTFTAASPDGITVTYRMRQRHLEGRKEGRKHFRSITQARLLESWDKDSQWAVVGMTAR